jgi:hypothetical protein
MRELKLFSLQITGRVQSWDHDDPTGLLIAATDAGAARAIAEKKWRDGYNRPDLADVWRSDTLSTAREMIPAATGLVGEVRVYHDAPIA